MLKTFLIAFGLFITLDVAWFRFVVRDFNIRQLAQLGRIENGQFDILYIPAIGTYVLMASAVAVFVLPRVMPLAPWWHATLYGALMGLIVYGVFDLTNLAIIKNYPRIFALVDMSWGVFAFAIVSTACWWLKPEA